MSKYEDFIELGAELIKEFGFQAQLRHVNLIANPAAPYETSSGTQTTPSTIYAVSFPNDGVTFITENVQINSRIFLVSPQRGALIAKGDTIIYNGKIVKVLDFKRVNPDESEDVIWSVLVS